MSEFYTLPCQTEAGCAYVNKLHEGWGSLTKRSCPDYQQVMVRLDMELQDGDCPMASIVAFNTASLALDHMIVMDEGPESPV
jgi:hypothetical protein